jgi:dienelactone hydrolase
MSPFGLWSQAVQFARRGWTAVAFMRRGYGRSQGGWAEDYGTCGRAHYAAAGQAGAQDITAAAKFMATEPYVSPGRWIAVGVSAGAFATVALTADAPPGLAAAISFAPGRGSTSADTVCDETDLIAAFAQFGRTSRTPLLWVSAANDHFFGPRLVDRLRTVFAAGGAKITFVATPPFGTDGHMLFSEASGIPTWTPIVDNFLRTQSLMLRPTLIDVPRPTAPTPPGLNSQGVNTFQTYLDSGPNKAFAVGGTHYGWATGRRSAQDARATALGYCESHAPPSCTVVNVNNQPTR